MHVQMLVHVWPSINEFNELELTLQDPAPSGCHVDRSTRHK